MNHGNEPRIAAVGSLHYNESAMKDPNGRTATVARKTRETDITLTIDLDAAGGTIRTGVPFFDHLLASMAFHGRFRLDIEASGDTEVDAHHLVEDTGLVLGQALSDILARAGQVARFGHAVIPMDEALSEVALDVCGRPTLAWRASFPQGWAGSFDLSLLREFLGGLAARAGISLHAVTRAGENSHHMAEALFKALGRALQQAYGPAEGAMSSKGRIG
jgi:imidazoleglycerol-phosphate dehydratase